MATVDAPVADTDRMHIVLGLGALEGYPVIFEKERLSVEDVLAGIPDEDLEEIGLSEVQISVLRLRVWAYTKLGYERCNDKVDGVHSLNLLELEADSMGKAMRLDKDTLRTIFPSVGTRRAFLNATAAELASKDNEQASKYISNVQFKMDQQFP
jgi:hypothetical protein